MPHKRTIPQVCLNCGIDFFARVDCVRAGGGRFCCRRCGRLHWLVTHPPHGRDKEKQRAANRRYYWRNPAEQRARKAETSIRDRPIHRESSHRYRARVRKLPTERILEQAVFDRDGGLCQLCHKPVIRSVMSIDHIIPIACGGSHTFQNVQLTHRLCNIRRQHRGPAQIRLI
jgi:5-methylcytosine-specific restriction endonuclease McrA